MSLWEDYAYDFDPDDNCDDVECKHCGEGELYWIKENDRWVLVDADEKKHVCPRKGAAPSEFEDLTSN